MYNVSYFKSGNEKDVIDFMHAHPFIILCGADSESQPVATHVPVLFGERDGKIILRAHVMKKQEHTIAFENNQKVLAIFYGPHTYVSASWYENKKIASTWNYQAIHAKGTLKFLDEHGLLQIITELTEHFENNPHSPSLLQKMDSEYVAKMMQAITGFEIEIHSIEHVFKLSQNRDEKSYHNIIDSLSAGDSEAKAVAAEMKKRLNPE